jgi:hypothetical protein
MNPERAGLCAAVMIIVLLLVVMYRPTSPPGLGSIGVPGILSETSTAMLPVDPTIAVESSLTENSLTELSVRSNLIGQPSTKLNRRPSGLTYPPADGDVLGQMISRQFTDPECRDMYSHHGIEKFRKTRQPVCLDGDTDAGVVYHQLPWIVGPGNADPHPSTVELRNVVRQADGSWTMPCKMLNAVELGNVRAKGHAWYDSGIGFTLDKMRLRSHGPGDLECTNPIDTPALFMTREKGGGYNMYHELAQLYATYLAKHIHGVSDNTADPHNLRVIVFDKAQRDLNNKFDQFFWRAFAQTRGAEPAEDLPAGTCFRQAILVHPGIRSIFWIGFGHKPTCFRYPMLEGFARFMLNGTTGRAAAATPRERTLCYVPRGTAARRLHGEMEFLAKLRAANPTLRIVDGVLGEGALRDYGEQVRWIQQCTLLAGTHGAGLTYAIFLPDEAVVVEHHPPGHGTFRGLTKALGHVFIHVETSNEHVGNFPAFARALRSAWQASNNFYHLHESTEFVVPENL